MHPIKHRAAGGRALCTCIDKSPIRRDALSAVSGKRRMSPAAVRRLWRRLRDVSRSHTDRAIVTKASSCADTPRPDDGVAAHLIYMYSTSFGQLSSRKCRRRSHQARANGLTCSHAHAGEQSAIRSTHTSCALFVTIPLVDKKMLYCCDSDDGRSKNAQQTSKDVRDNHLRPDYTGMLTLRRMQTQRGVQLTSRIGWGRPDLQRGSRLDRAILCSTLEASNNRKLMKCVP
jgi:hypothetical protein